MILYMTHEADVSLFRGVPYSGLWTLDSGLPSFRVIFGMWHVFYVILQYIHTVHSLFIPKFILLHIIVDVGCIHLDSPVPRFHPTTINEAGICSTCWTAFCVCTSVRACAVLAPCTPKAIRIALTACVRSRDHKWSRTGALKELISAKILWLYQARSQVLVMHSKLD
jgi:hypothetical protein